MPIWATRPSNGSELESKHSGNQHQLQERAGLLSCVRLIEVGHFFKLTTPLPRSQDLPAASFGAPSSCDDQVVSVSHAWRNQAHPDPTCQKSKLLGQILSQFTAGSSDAGTEQRRSVFLFFDFLSIPQRPFRPGQQDRTAEEMEIFKGALHCMHEMYFYSDRIIHLPWEDAEVSGEGVEETLPARALVGADFAKIGASVQIISLRGVPQEEGRSEGAAKLLDGRSEGTANLFDQVVSVDGEMVDSTTQLASLLAADPKLVTVRHYPFGNYSMIPADERGWVFLERFITMVKCAMMDEDTAKHVVVTPSDTIFQQIMCGAHLLREAALKEMAQSKQRGESGTAIGAHYLGEASSEPMAQSRQGELSRILESFKKELRSKRFSPASTDKRELASSTAESDDRSVVFKIMQEFVEHLSGHWEAEAAKQRRLGNMLKAAVARAEAYLVEWECFSEEYTAMLTAASETWPWHVPLVILIPPAVAVAPLLWPYNSPDAGWASQGALWGLSFPVMVFVCSFTFAVGLAKITNTLYSRTMLLLHVAWAITVTIIAIAMGIGVAAAWQVFPVPFLPFAAVGLLGVSIPLLWWSVPRKRRASKSFRVRLATTLKALIVILSLYGVGVPLLNAAIPVVSEGWQPLLAACYLVLKLAFEFFMLKLSKVLGADSMTYFIFIAGFLYQVNLCIAFSKVTSWFLVALQICFDVAENAYHLFSLFQQHDASDKDHSDDGGTHRAQYIIASLALREFVEVLVPGVFLAMHELVRAVRPENFDLFCNRPEREVERTVHFLLAATAVELAGSCVAYSVLRSWGHKPLLLLRGLIATRYDSFVLIACAALAFYWTTQHSHYGMDLSFQLLWVIQPNDAVWQCGLTWAT